VPKTANKERREYTRFHLLYNLGYLYYKRNLASEGKIPLVVEYVN
jgi:hypothetical protein